MKKREIEFDILRLLALFAVIWVHVGGMETSSLPTSDRNCQILIFMKSIMTWQVPIYVMISGRFFLDPERQMPFSKILKSIRRLIIAFVAWNIIYQIYYILTNTYTGLNWKGILLQIMIGPYHFWYLYMIIGMYLITPFLRKIIVDKQLAEYFIVLFFLFTFLTKYGVELPFIGDLVRNALDSMGMKFVLGYSGYYVLGYYLYRYPVSAKWERLLYVGSVILVLLGAAANTIQSIWNESYTEWYTGYIAPNTIIIASAIYTFFIKYVGKIQFSKKIVDRITAFSTYSFGVYLAHALILALFLMVGLKPTILHPIIAMPVITLVTFVVTLGVIVIISKISHLGKWII